MLSFNIDNTEEIAQNKLLILYIIKMSPKKFNNTTLSEFILEKNYMNYFAFQQYISEMLSGELIVIDVDEGVKYYSILEKGELTLDLLQSKIPEKIIQELSSEFKLQELVKVRETQIIGECFKKENDQFSVNLKLVENDETLFSLYFDVATKAQGDKFCDLEK
jgi:predicted transcriptional regulator